MKWLVLAAAFMLPLAAQAQQPTAADRSIILSLGLQKAAVEAQNIAADVQGQLRAAHDRIAELERLCGDLCKPKPAAEQK